MRILRATAFVILSAAALTGAKAEACTPNGLIYRNVETYLYMHEKSVQNAEGYHQMTLDCQNVIAEQIEATRRAGKPKGDYAPYVTQIRLIDSYWKRSPVAISDLLTVLQSSWEFGHLEDFKLYNQVFRDAVEMSEQVAFYAGMFYVARSALSPVRTALYFRSFLKMFAKSGAVVVASAAVGAAVVPLIDYTEKSVKPHEIVPPAPAQISVNALSLEDEEDYAAEASELYRDLARDIVSTGLGVAAVTLSKVRVGAQLTQMGISATKVSPMTIVASLVAGAGVHWGSGKLIKWLEDRTVQASRERELLDAARDYYVLSQRRARESEMQEAAIRLTNAAVSLSLMKRLPLLKAQIEFDEALSQAMVEAGGDEAKFAPKKLELQKELEGKIARYMKNQGQFTSPMVRTYLMYRDLESEGFDPLSRHEADTIRAMDRCRGYRVALPILNAYFRRVNQAVRDGQLNLAGKNDSSRRELFDFFLEEERAKLEREQANELLNGRIAAHPEGVLIQASSMLKSRTAHYEQFFANRILIDRAFKTTIFVEPAQNADLKRECTAAWAARAQRTQEAR